MNIALVILMAMIAEAVWETLKMIWQEGKISIDRIGALVVSLVIAFGFRLNLFELPIFEVQTYIPLLGTLLTGILISRGSNFIHDLFTAMSTIYDN